MGRENRSIPVNDANLMDPPHWILSWLQDEPTALPEIWEEHKKINAPFIPVLRREAVSQIFRRLKGGQFPEEVAELFAEVLPCEYLDRLEQNKRHPRHSKVQSETMAIRSAALALQRALKSASGATLGHLHWEFFCPLPPGKTNKEMIPKWEAFHKSEEGKRLVEVGNSFLSSDIESRTGGAFIEDTCVNPEMAYSLGELAHAAQRLHGRIPDDVGGPVSGKHDSTGVLARKASAIEVRAILRYFGLPFGAQKRGPVSLLLGEINQAATGEDASWADRFAAMTPKLEKVK